MFNEYEKFDEDNVADNSKVSAPSLENSLSKTKSKYNCEEGGCGKSYNHARSIWRHNKNKHLNSAKQQFKCTYDDVCDKETFKCIYECLKDHESAVHQKIRYVCRDCESEFSYLASIKRHEKEGHINAIGKDVIHFEDKVVKLEQFDQAKHQLKDLHQVVLTPWYGLHDDGIEEMKNVTVGVTKTNNLISCQFTIFFDNKLLVKSKEEGSPRLK